MEGRGGDVSENLGVDGGGCKCAKQKRRGRNRHIHRSCWQLSGDCHHAN